MSMEKLAELSAAANAAGMSYGVYMSIHGTTPPPPKRHIPSYLRSALKCCALCGEPIVGRHPATKYCDACRAAVTTKQKTDYARRRRGEKL